MEGGFRWDTDVVSYFTLPKQAITDLGIASACVVQPGDMAVGMNDYYASCNLSFAVPESLAWIIALSLSVSLFPVLGPLWCTAAHCTV